MSQDVNKASEPISGRNIHGGKEASSSTDPNSLYPDGVDPRLSDEDHNTRGQWSPYSEKQRKAAAVLIRQYRNRGMTLQDATDRAFEEVGEPELIDEVTQGRHKENTKDSINKAKH